MRALCALLSVLVALCDCNVDVPITNHWPGGFQGLACFDITKELHGWNVHIIFDQPIKSLEVWVADVKTILDGGKEFVLTSKSWNRDEHVGDELCINFIGRGEGTADIAPKVTASMEELPNGGSHGPVTQAPASNVTGSMAPVSTVTAASGQTLPTTTTTIPTTPRTVAPPTGNGTLGTLTINQDWGERFDGQLTFPVGEDIMGWMVNISFSKPVSKMDIQNGDAIYHSPDGYNWIVVNKGQYAVVKQGDQLVLKFFGNYLGGKPAPQGQGMLINLGKDDWTIPEAPNTDGSKYNYNDILYKSVLFYEAQRSGKLPSTNRIPYRGDSALGDKGQNGEDLTGGWYDAGDHVKFNFPMAYSTTILAWGYIMWPEAYVDAGQKDYLLDCIKWPLDYLLKCHTGPEELYVQVGDAGQDHSYWGPPEEMTMASGRFKPWQ